MDKFNIKKHKSILRIQLFKDLFFLYKGNRLKI